MYEDITETTARNPNAARTDPGLNTGKVQIGIRFNETRKPMPMTSEGEFIQSVLLGSFAAERHERRVAAGCVIAVVAALLLFLLAG